MAHADVNSPDKRKAWRARNPEKDAAHRAVESFVRQLKRRGLPKPDCECCGKSDAQSRAAHAKGHGTQAHHTDYSRPLDVTWLCPNCHITGHWNSSWRADRAGKIVRYITRTTVVEEK